ncbi:MAG: rRNA methyltransferase [Caulobacterales bacterium 32-69-10]|nr:MAG: rRNA methyltransferase [Caulobacterales bacterium 32-69-10]
MSDKPPEKPPEKPGEERRRMVRLPTRGEVGGRSTALGERVKTADYRSQSSQAWLGRQLNDPYVKAAKAQGYRSRAAFKLSEIDDKARLIKRGSKIIDLGCAPGGWLQVVKQRGAGAVVGIDLLPVDPLPGVELIEGDFTDPGMGDLLIERLGGAPDIVMSDMAPNTTGHRQTDHLRIVGLVEAAVDFAIAVLVPGGVFVSKAFQGGETEALLKLLKRHFKDVRHVKPNASRAQSSELYLVATGFRGRQP